MQRVMAAFAPHCADSALPRTLAARLLREAGFTVGRITPYPILNTEWRDDSYSCRVIGFIDAYVRRQKTVPAAELDAWAAELAELGRRGEYYFLSTVSSRSTKRADRNSNHELHHHTCHHA